MVQDATIVGGSAGGLFTASLLARQGLHVTLVERTRRLEPAARTLIVTDRMRAVLGPSAGASVINEIRHFELFADGQAATISLARPDLVIERSTLIRELAKEAESAGAVLLLGRRFLDLRGEDGSITVSMAVDGHGRTENLSAKALVGADGAMSAVARAAGWAPQPTVPLLQALVRLPEDLPLDTVRVWFRPKDTPYFYWLIPESPARAVLGVIGESGPETRRRLDRFIGDRSLVPIEYQAAQIPLYRRGPIHRRIGQGHVYLVGDAAGQVKVTTVGGVVTGLRGAQAVAGEILGGRSRRESRALRRELDRHLMARRILHHFGEDDYRRLLAQLDGRAARILTRHSRDEAGAIIWRLLAARPQILLLGLRAFLTGLAAGGDRPP